MWQIHIFSEGNTRTTALFLIKYLRKLNFNITNDILALNSWYFRNPLVRANYTNISKNVYETTEYLELFLRNLVLNEKNELKNRYLHIYYKSQRQDIESQKQDFDFTLLDDLNKKNKELVKRLFVIFGYDDYFGRQDITNVFKLFNSAVSNLLKRLLDKEIISKIYGHGKGKYVFKK